MTTIAQTVRSSAASGHKMTTLNAAEVASLLGWRTETAQKWIAKNQKRLKAWKSDYVGQPWRVTLGNLRRSCLQLGLGSIA